jgi:hypothetical protein
MRALAIAISIGLAAAAAKLSLLFSVWLLPQVLDAVNALLLVVALGVLAVLALKKRRRVAAASVVAALAFGMLDLPLGDWIAHARVREAQAYCEALGTCAGAGCGASASHAEAAVIPKLPGHTLPVLLRAGYSVRYPAHFQSMPGALECSFPDPFPGRSFWSGEGLPDGGSWTWENDMD